MQRTLLAAALVASFTPALAAANAANFGPGVTKLWTFQHTAPQSSEVVAFDAATNTLWVAGTTGVDVLNAQTGSFIAQIAAPVGGLINGVAVRNGLAAFAVEVYADAASGDRRNPGSVHFFDTATRHALGSVSVGSLPDMLTFTPDGRKLLVANEGTPNRAADLPYSLPDPAGSVSIIDVATRTVIATPGFVGVPQSGSHLRTHTGMDFEPEYIAVKADGSKAFVALQEANGLAILDLDTHTFTQVVGLGAKDFNLPGNGIDPSDRDNEIRLRNVPVKGFYQPDAITTVEINGQTFIVTANEGDTREDNGDRVRASSLGATGELARLFVSGPDSSAGDLYAFGARSFSIFDEHGNRVYDSGNILEAEAIARGIYDDSRSAARGVEPEAVSVLEIAGRTFVFVGLERTTRSAVAVFDISNPAQSRFMDMIVTDGDRSPEVLTAYAHNGQYFLAVANEVSHTTSLYRLTTPIPEPETYALMLAGLGLVAAAVARRRRR